MARMPRLVIAGVLLHSAAGNDRQAVFYNEDDYLHYLTYLTESAEKLGCAIHAYMLMTNHVHLLVTPSAEESLSAMMQSIGRRYRRYIHGLYRRTGTLCAPYRIAIKQQ